MKDNLSHNSSNYAQFRPTYPDEVFTFLKTILTGNKRVWDCATGTGQLAGKLVNLFDEVYATDLSENQLKNAVLNPKIHYSKQIAEQTDFPDQYFDCITVGQAVHWFDFAKFYAEAKRVLKPNDLIIILMLTQNLCGYIKPVSSPFRNLFFHFEKYSQIFSF